MPHLVVDDVPGLRHHPVVGVRKGVVAYSGRPKGVADDLGGLADPLHGAADVIRGQQCQSAAQRVARAVYLRGPFTCLVIHGTMHRIAGCHALNTRSRTCEAEELWHYPLEQKGGQAEAVVS